MTWLENAKEKEDNKNLFFLKEKKKKLPKHFHWEDLKTLTLRY